MSFKTTTFPALRARGLIGAASRRETLSLLSAGVAAASLAGCASASTQTASTEGALTMEQIANGLTPEQELFFPSQPDNPQMRESTSIWLYEENGEFAFPRIGIEAEAWQWDNRLFTGNMTPGGDRVLWVAGRGPGPSPLDADGRPTILGAGPVTFQMIEPFRKWRMTVEGQAIDTSVQDQIARAIDRSKTVPVRLDVEMEMATPCWVQDNSPEKVARMTEEERAEAESMGIGWRLEHLFRATGSFTVDGQTREFRGQGSRIKRQSVRPLDNFRGHVWQSALFPDGRAFGYCAYPPFDDSDTDPYNDGYVYQDGVMYPARAKNMPFLRRLYGNGEDVSVELEYERGTIQIGGVSKFATYKSLGPEFENIGDDFFLQQAGAHYTWDGQSAYGMIERSSLGRNMDPT